MNYSQIQGMPIEEKLLLMETLWADLQDHFDHGPVDDDVQTLLRQRLQNAESGATQLLDWDEVKHTLGR